MVGKRMEFNGWEDIAIECNGKIVTGTYCVSDWMITVKIESGRDKSTQLGNTPPKTLAESLLRELSETTD
jgi:hypothetical protein